MKNFAVKFAILTSGVTGGEQWTVRDYLDLCPHEALLKYKSLLSEADRGVLLFGFSDDAILNVLDHEFDVDLENHTLVFRKPFLNAESIRLAGTGRDNLGAERFGPKEQVLVENLATWLLDATRTLYRQDLNSSRLADVRLEYAENFKTYALKNVPDYDPDGIELLLRSLFGSIKAMRAFCHSLTVDAMFKADAAKVIFGEESSYHQAWFRKQIFRHMMSKAVDAYINSCTV